MRLQCSNCRCYGLGAITVGASGNPLDYPIAICPHCDYVGDKNAGPPAELESRVKDVTW